MKRREKILIIIIVALAITSVGSLTLPVVRHVWIRLMVSRPIKMRGEMREDLLCKTDFQALLIACRELSNRAAKGELKPGTYFIGNEPRDPRVLSFPQPILDLAPSDVYIDENDSGRVMLEMSGGLDHFGILAYTEDYKNPSWSDKYGDRELISGLWYYDDNYKKIPNYDARVEALLQKRKDN